MSTLHLGWWSRRSLTLRLTIVATIVLAIGLMSGAVGLATLFYHSRIAAVDSNVRVEAATITTLVQSAQLPEPLPVPADQPVFAQVLAADGTVRAATPSASRVVPLLPLSVVTGAASGEPFTTTRTALGSASMRVIVTKTRTDGEPAFVVTAVSLSDVGAILDALFRILVIAVPVILLAAAIATWVAVGSALRPVDELRAAADEVATTRGGTGAHLPVPESGDELARLAVTLNRMLERLYQATEQQRTFVADAAHELRSPIASIRAQLEVALATSSDADEWQRVGVDALRDVERMELLAEDMLLLARLDSGVAGRRQLVDVNAVLGRDDPALWVRADPLALRRAFDNVIANAHRHASGQVAVRVSLEGLDVVVTVDDDGPGIAPADRERVFERWLRLDDARARDAGGAGLGLAITRSVMTSQGGGITLEESPLGGVRAVLRLPAAAPEHPAPDQQPVPSRQPAP